MANVWCNSFFYNSVSKQCRLQRYVFMSLKDSTFNDTGSRYYRLKSESCPLEEGYVVDRVTSTCYRPVRKPNKSWVDARTACIADESDLVVLEPVEKLDFLYNLFVKNFNCTTQKM
nr:hypothetical protein BaRGS_001870 [Batillaria attramentaria]